MNITNETVSAYIDTLYAPLSDALFAIRSKAETRHIPIISKDTEMFLMNLMRIKKPKHILEIGTAVGYSAVCFAMRSKCESAVSIEINEEMYEEALENIETLGLSGRVEIWLGDAEKVIRENLQDRKFDFVFIDAAKSRYKRFFEAALTVCGSEAVVVSDNVLLDGLVAFNECTHKRRTSMRKMREYIDYLMTLENAETSLIPIGDGVALTVLEAL